MKTALAIAAIFLCLCFSAEAQRRPAPTRAPAAAPKAAPFTTPRIALIRPDNTIDKVVASSTVDPDAALRAGWKWLPIPAVTPPTFDDTAEIRTGPWPTLTVGANSVVESYPKRAKTAGELDADKTSSVDGLDAVVLRVLCNHENRIRAVTPSPPAQLTLAQCRAAIKGMLP